MTPFKEETSISPIIKASLTIKAGQLIFKFTDGEDNYSQDHRNYLEYEHLKMYVQYRGYDSQ
jgi:hypothetical protein